MINHSRRFIAEPLAGHQQPVPEFGVLVSYLRSWCGPQIDAESPMLFEHALPKRHVRAIRRALQFNCVIPQVELSEDYAAPILLEVLGYPSWRFKLLRWKGPSPRTSPFAIAQQCCCEILQPCGLDLHIIVHEDQDLASRIFNSGIKRMGFTRPWFKQVPKALGIPEAEVLNGVARLI